MDPARACQVCHGATAVYCCANAADTDLYGLFPPVTDGIIEDVASAGAKLVFCDNLYMYGTVSGPVKEDLRYRATGRKGSTRAQMATTVMETHKSGKVRVTIRRTSDYFGLHSLVSQYLFGPVLAGEVVTVFGNPEVNFSTFLTIKSNS